MHFSRKSARIAVTITFATFLLSFHGSLSARPQISKQSPDTQPVALRVLRGCVTCHNPNLSSGGLDLSTQASASSHNSALVVGKPTLSNMIKRVQSLTMPPKMPLSVAERQALISWVAAGAPYPAALVAANDKPKSWAFTAITQPNVPIIRTRTASTNPIDDFVLSGLAAKRLKMAPPADRATLLRRVVLDLTGLPPTPEMLKLFLADKRPDAYARLVDRLLASPDYGERYARHWLDVARFGESHGYEYDNLRENAWPFRDYVVNAFNRDLPYDRFLQEQIAGDAGVSPDERGIVATGFLVAGPMDEAGKNAPGLQVRQRAREEELEDIVSVVSQTCFALTVNCARCHDHKFDPIPQQDFYKIRAALTGVQPGERNIPAPVPSSAILQQISDINRQLEQVGNSIAIASEPFRPTGSGAKQSQASPQPKLRWTFDGGPDDAAVTHGSELLGGARIQGGRLELPVGNASFKSRAIPIGLASKTLETWVQLSTLNQAAGSALTTQSLNGVDFDAVVYAERSARRWMAGSTGFERTRDVVESDETSADRELTQIVITYAADNRITIYRNGKVIGPAYTPSAAPLSLGPAQWQIVFGHRHSGSAGFLIGSIEEARIYDRALTPKEVELTFRNTPSRVSDEDVLVAMNQRDRDAFKLLLSSRQALLQQREKLTPRPQTIRTTYGAVSTTPPVTYVLSRGDVTLPRNAVGPGALSAVTALKADFIIPANAPEPDRRKALAAWITDIKNPLTSRVMVNRIWQWHFGTGLVSTPNDFGSNGEKPSNQPLLDWLAHTFMNAQPEYGPAWSIKKMHRLIVTSKTYRQSSRPNPAASMVDADNRLLWRFAPRRLEAEVIRDSMLMAAGNLNPAKGGPSYRPFTVSAYGSKFYALVDADTPDFNRRTLYRMGVHSARSPLLESLDCPDLSSKTPKRSVSTTPTQALEMMNDSFVIRQSRVLASRILAQVKGDLSRQVRLAIELTLGRVATLIELKRGLNFLWVNRLEAYCWTLLNSSGFAYID